MSVPIYKQTYGERAEKHQVAVAKKLLNLMQRKSTNLCVSVDVTTKKEFLQIIDAVGPHCCLIKTHIDIISDFDQDLVEQLSALSEKHEFLIFEDRKFADIGNTVSLQYSSGVYKIASWSHIVNAHVVPGDGIIAGLGKVGKPLNRGLLLLAEMSSKGNLATGTYTAQTLEMAQRNKDFVMGFIALHRPQNPVSTPQEDFIIMTPGVAIDVKGDAMGQQYKTPEEIVGQRHSDVPIVGRAIYSCATAADGSFDKQAVLNQAKIYRDACWNAYLERLSS